MDPTTTPIQTGVLITTMEVVVQPTLLLRARVLVLVLVSARDLARTRRRVFPSVSVTVNGKDCASERGGVGKRGVFSPLLWVD